MAEDRNGKNKIACLEKEQLKKHLETEGGGIMVAKQYTAYNKFYKPKNKTLLLPEFWYHVLTTQKKERVPYSEFYNKQK